MILETDNREGQALALRYLVEKPVARDKFPLALRLLLLLLKQFVKVCVFYQQFAINNLQFPVVLLG